MGGIGEVVASRVRGSTFKHSCVNSALVVANYPPCGETSLPVWWSISVCSIVMISAKICPAWAEDCSLTIVIWRDACLHWGWQDGNAWLLWTDTEGIIRTLAGLLGRWVYRVCKTYKGRVATAGQSYGQLLQQSIMTILYPFQNNSKRSQSFIVVGSGGYKVVLALLGRFPCNRWTFMGNHI